MKKEQHTDPSRRDALKKLFRGTGLLGIGGSVWAGLAEGFAENRFTLRPPGAIEEKDFLKACVKCGACVEACPYDTLNLAGINDPAPNGTPFFSPREIPCYMCQDYPCVPACPSKALDEMLLVKENDSDEAESATINAAKMGLAVVHKESCIAFWGIQCDACYRACPLIDEAITLEYTQNERTGKHAFLKPVVNSNVCTGCGICEHTCVTEVPAIRVLPLDKSTGKVGSHYIKGWDTNDEKRLENVDDQVTGDDNLKKTQEYLDDWESLIDE